jgi:hypothetical protein
MLNCRESDLREAALPSRAQPLGRQPRTTRAGGCWHRQREKTRRREPHVPNRPFCALQAPPRSRWITYWIRNMIVMTACESDLRKRTSDLYT